MMNNSLKVLMQAQQVQAVYSNVQVRVEERHEKQVLHWIRTVLSLDDLSKLDSPLKMQILTWIVAYHALRTDLFPITEEYVKDRTQDLELAWNLLQRCLLQLHHQQQKQIPIIADSASSTHAAEKKKEEKDAQKQENGTEITTEESTAESVAETTTETPAETPSDTITEIAREFASETVSETSTDAEKVEAEDSTAAPADTTDSTSTSTTTPADTAATTTATASTAADAASTAVSSTDAPEQESLALQLDFMAMEIAYKLRDPVRILFSFDHCATHYAFDSLSTERMLALWMQSVTLGRWTYFLHKWPIIQQHSNDEDMQLYNLRPLAVRNQNVVDFYGIYQRLSTLEQPWPDAPLETLQFARHHITAVKWTAIGQRGTDQSMIDKYMDIKAASDGVWKHVQPGSLITSIGACKRCPSFVSNQIVNCGRSTRNWFTLQGEVFFRNTEHGVTRLREKFVDFHRLTPQEAREECSGSEEYDSTSEYWRGTYVFSETPDDEKNVGQMTDVVPCEKEPLMEAIFMIVMKLQPANIQHPIV